MKHLSIVHTESSLGWGEQEKRVLATARGLIARGHDVRLICPSEARIGAEAVEARVPVKALPIGKLRPIGVKVLVEWLKAHPCDVVHTHNSTDCWLAAFALLALGRRIPMVRTDHETASMNFATRWLYTRAVARVIVASEHGDMANLERVYAQVRR